MFEMSHCSRYKANMSSIVVSQMCCEVYFISLQYRSRYKIWLPNLTEIAPLTLLAEPAPAYYSTRAALTRCCTMCHSNEHKLLSPLQVTRPEQNTAPNAETMQFITAKIPDRRQRLKTGEQNTLNATSVQFTTSVVILADYC